MLGFLIDIPTFLAIYSGLLLQTLSKMHEEIFSIKCESASDKLHLLCVISRLHAVHPLKGYRYSFYINLTHQITVGSLGYNKLEVSGRKWFRRNNKRNKKITDWNS
jgi:hypothetical protein